MAKKRTASKSGKSRASTGRRPNKARVASAPRKSYYKPKTKAKKSYYRRPNPGNVMDFAMSALKKSVPFGLGIVGTDLVQAAVPIAWGGLGGKMVIRGAAAIALGWAASYVPFVGRANGELLAAGGLAGIVQDGFRLLYSRFGGVLAPTAQPVVIGPPVQAQLAPGAVPTTDEEAVGDIVLVPDGFNDLGMIVDDPGMDQWTH